jgi:hypothetical protein
MNNLSYDLITLFCIFLYFIFLKLNLNCVYIYTVYKKYFNKIIDNILVGL